MNDYRQKPDGTFKWVIGAGMVLFLALMGVTDEIGAASIPIWIAAMVGIATALRGPLGAAMAKRIAGEPVDANALPPEETLAELDDLRRRVYELEERVDFSERLLAQRPIEPADADGSAT
jgi:hypothetical protein